MKNIVIALDDGKAPQRNQITNFFAAKGWAYWHWVDDFWIVQVPNEYTPQSLYKILMELPNSTSTTPTILLFELPGNIRYWGSAHKDAWEWLQNIGEPSP